MPTRTINLKLVLGTKTETAGLRRALWTTHTQINQAVAEIERILLLCRGRSYWTRDAADEEIQIPESQVIDEALKMAREAQRRNGKPGAGGDLEVLSALRMLYEQIVPSCRLDGKGEPLKGDAQSIGSGYAGPLFDPDTCRIKEDKCEDECGPFAETASKTLEDLPGWITTIEKDAFIKSHPTHFKFKNASGVESFYQVDIVAANRWYETESVQTMLADNKAFNKDGWKKKKENGDDSWAVDFATKQMDLSEDPRIHIRETLWKRLGLLPIGSPFFDKNAVGNLWNRLAVRLAVAHLLSWESWNHATKKEHDAAKTKVKQLEDEYRPLSHQFTLLRQYEAARHRELKKTALADDARPFRIGPRGIRAWERVREAWLQDGHDETVRRQALKDLQTKLPGKFGDPDLFRWLAEPGREHLWKDADSLTTLVRLNVARRLLEKRKPYSLMTFADARLHPRWTMYEAPGGSNLRNYAIRQTGTGVAIEILLLVQDGTGKWAEQTFRAPLAPSGQLSNLTVEDGESGGKKRFKYRSGHQDFEGVPGGAELLFDRPYLENPQRTEEILSQRPGSVWFKLTLDVQSQAPDGWLDGRGRPTAPSEMKHFNTALSNTSKYEDELTPGLRVLSVDLGLRTFAACSVFELVKGKPEKGLCFPAADGRRENDPGKLWARHERSFKLALPGEKPTRQEERARKAVQDEVYSLKRDIRRLKDILRLGVAEDEAKRDELVQVLLESLDDSAADSGLDRAMFSGLGERKFRSTPELWIQHCQTYYDRAEKAISDRFGAWRRRTRPKSASWDDWRARRSYHGGKSIWMVEYLDGVRKLILSWNLRGKKYGEINRQDKRQFGTVASRLLHHINQLKEDRVKSGADLIIQAARGFAPIEDGRGWRKSHEPCRVILFEDLARYRFRVDRPRRENSQLMKWNHRQILDETAMQGELYGITIATTAAGFSSRFLAGSGAPGVRCRRLTVDDFEHGLPKAYVARELDWMLGPGKLQGLQETQHALKGRIRPGMWVPWNGGELFASVTRDGAAHVIHADINAAQNLQRRFWGRCGDAFRIGCKKDGQPGKEAWELEKAPGARLLGALQQLPNGQGEFSLVPAQMGNNVDSTYVMTAKDGKRKKLKAESDEKAGGEIEEEFEAALVDVQEDATGNRQTFFRDPSGTVFSSEYWVSSKIFWAQTRQAAWTAMQKKTGTPDARLRDELPF